MTSVFDAGALTAGDACRELRVSLQQFVGQPRLLDTSFSCGWEANLSSGAVARGCVATADQLRPLAPTGSLGPRWSDAIEVPPSPLVVWVEFNSLLE